ILIQANAPSFATALNLRNVVTRHVPLALIAIGQTMVIISGQIDLSVGSVMALSAVTAALLLPTQSVAVAVGAALAVGAACGMVSGLVTTRAKVPSFVVTLAMMGLARGLALAVAGLAGLGWLRRGGPLTAD
ncbi:MAG: ABC transporter permease, partial [Candidatus Brocadiae bacterium]|nr:ABC transporter permease [Candidatus Brocadiia bacterium]